MDADFTGASSVANFGQLPLDSVFDWAFGSKEGFGYEKRNPVSRG
jgi:hypothetical protein